MAEKKKTETFTAAERQAMKDRAAEAKRAASAEADLKAFMEKVNRMPKDEKEMALRIKTLVEKHAPHLVPKTWYGMPSFYSPGKTGKVIMFFQNAAMFKVRVSTLGFSEHSNLDDGNFWPMSFALIKLTPKVESQIKELIIKAAS
jgi:uncharacterized protein YdhG (YjbR/CyaY superfamily)